VKAALGLTLYVMAYGIGPMFLTPLQELPSLGRNPVYIITLAIFVLFNVPIVTAKNFSTILAFRFLTGFVASPALATGVGIVKHFAINCDVLTTHHLRAPLWETFFRLIGFLTRLVYGH